MKPKQKSDFVSLTLMTFPNFWALLDEASTLEGRMKEESKHLEVSAAHPLPHSVYPRSRETTPQPRHPCGFLFWHLWAPQLVGGNRDPGFSLCWFVCKHQNSFSGPSRSERGQKGVWACYGLPSWVFRIKACFISFPAFSTVSEVPCLDTPPTKKNALCAQGIWKELNHSL